MTPLHIAAYTGNMACLGILLKHQAPLEQRDRYGRTPLAAAQFREHDDLAIEILESGASAKDGLKRRHDTTFSVAVELGRVKAVEALIEAGVTVKAEALRVAKEESRTEVTEVLRRALQKESTQRKGG